MKRLHFSTTQVVMLGFAAAILAGALLLMIPAATAPGEHTDFITALFTATSSICVTGLVVVDTFSHWSLFGQVIVLLLIQLGGFGVITLYSVVIMLMHRRFSLGTHKMIQDYYDLDSVFDLRGFLKRVVVDTLIVEGLGAVAYAFVFVPQFGLRGIWISLFNSVSAFCNAGMDVIGPDSLIPYRDNDAVNAITCTLIIVSGIGYIVWFDVLDSIKRTRKNGLGVRGFFSRLSPHSRLAIVLTLFLLMSGTILVFIFEYHNPDTIGTLSLWGKLRASFFQSVTFRTAGFATVPQASLTVPTSITGCVYMFIGGSPVGTAGGVKTVTMFVAVLNSVSFIRSRDETVVFSRRITSEMKNKATAIITVSFGFTMLLYVLMLWICKTDPVAAAYEIFSATGTVGLSQGLTPSLDTAGRLIVIAGMYAGRIGPISMGLFFSTGKSSKNLISFADGNFKLG